MLEKQFSKMGWNGPTLDGGHKDPPPSQEAGWRARPSNFFFKISFL